MNLPSTSTQRLLSWSWRGSTRLAAPASESCLAKPCTSLSSSFFLSNSEPISYWTKINQEVIRSRGLSPETSGVSTERRVDVLEYYRFTPILTFNSELKNKTFIYPHTHTTTQHSNKTDKICFSVTYTVCV